MRRAGLAIAVALVGALLGGCTWATPTPAGPGQAQLAALPEAALLYPGAAVLEQGGRDARPEGGTDRPIPAVVGATLGAQATPAEIVAFYDRELLARGWARFTSPPIASALEIRTAGWGRGGLSFRLGVYRPKDEPDPRLPPLEVRRQYATIFRFIIEPPR